MMVYLVIKWGANPTWVYADRAKAIEVMNQCNKNYPHERWIVQELEVSR